MKQRAIESRFGFTGGVNYSVTADGLQPNELLLCKDARVLIDGAVQRRAGTTKMNAGSLLGSAGVPQVVGLFYWYGPTGGAIEYLAVANGTLYSSSDLATWVSEGALVATNSSHPSFFVEMADGANSIVYFTAGLRLWSWDGTTLVDQTTTNGAPAANILALYNDRLFCNHVSSPQELFWSALGDGSDFAVAGLSGGGSAVLQLSEGDGLTGLATLGSSLLIATSKTVARFTGTADDIELLTDTEGVTADVGVMTRNRLYPAQGAFQRTDAFASMFTERGPYLVNEGGAAAINHKLQTDRTDVKWWPRSRAFVGHNADATRNEVWFIYRKYSEGADGGGLDYPSTAMVYNKLTRAFSGPFNLPAQVCCVATMPHPTTNQMTLYAGCADRLVRQLDDPAVSRDDGATDYTHTVQFAPFIFDAAGPFNTKKVRHIFLQAQREDADTVPTVKIYPDSGAAETAALVADDAVVDGPTNLRYDVDSSGKRFVVEVSGAYNASADGDNPKIIGAIVEGSVMERW